MEMKRDEEGFIVFEEIVPLTLEAKAAEWKLNSPTYFQRYAEKHRGESKPSFFYTSADYDPDVIKVNLGKKIEIIKPEGYKKKKIKSWRDLIPKLLGATFSLDKDGFDFRFFFE